MPITLKIMPVSCACVRISFARYDGFETRAKRPERKSACSAKEVGSEQCVVIVRDERERRGNTAADHWVQKRIANPAYDANNFCTMIEVERLVRDFEKMTHSLGVGELARRAHVDRSAVWRLRNGEVRLLSKGVRRLCEAAGLNAANYERSVSPAKSRKLMKALADTWDGTAAQADAICSVLRALRRVPRVVINRTDNTLPRTSRPRNVKK